jgi:polar amino acid transport system permease protein
MGPPDVRSQVSTFPLPRQLSKRREPDRAPDPRPADSPVRAARPVRVVRPFPLLDVVLGAGVLVIAALLTNSLARNQQLSWGTVGTYLFSPAILRGVWTTVWLAVVCMALAVVVGLVSALMGQATSRVLRALSTAYVWGFRGVPVLVQLIFWYNLALLFPKLSLGPVGAWDTNKVISPLTAAIIGLTLAEGAFMSEIIRAGMQSVDRGQHEAAAALGLTRIRMLRRITLPQAVRLIIPPTGNEFITMLKGTSLVSAISVGELLFSAENIYNANYRVPALLIVASLWYLFLTSLATIGQGALERYYARRS